MSRDDIGGYGGPSDDGVAAQAWRMAWQIDGAREEFVESGAPVGVDSVSPMVEALTAALAGVDLSPVSEARAGGQELGWSARSGRQA
ncbi:hypothetical protein [Streptomyces liliifuscus]|uniref:Uncharacterized protein n=1 Tax=Streptomyces liliifuscus TaxID=2797636 RepID=A0A7T7I6M1_9ACTN|nr:hypothetical protein [Streptomyces liliifuscus]QQM41984.1 hypothetical protein JEQ17_22755 [Streptomyces liliifuscus]